MEVDVVEIAQEIYRAAKRLNKSGDTLTLTELCKEDKHE